MLTIFRHRKLPIPEQSQYTIIGGFQIAASNIYTSSATIAFGGAVGRTVMFYGNLPQQYLNHTAFSGNGSVTFLDPMSEMIAGIREISFRHAVATAVKAAKQDVAAGNNSQSSILGSMQSVPYVGKQMQTVYKTNWRYGISATAINLLGIIAVIPVFWGFWTLGRDTTMSPIEIAKAFQAPILDDVTSNADVEQLIKEKGELTIKYGVVDKGPENDASK